jgi:hypothetical protein
MAIWTSLSFAGVRCELCKEDFAYTNQTEKIDIHPQDAEITCIFHLNCLKDFYRSGQEGCPLKCGRVVVLPTCQPPLPKVRGLKEN